MDLVVTVCAFNVQVLRGLHVPNDRIFVVPCGVDVPVETSPVGPDVDIVAVGRMVPKKGFADLVEAVGRLRRVRPSLSVEIIGDGPEWEPLSRLVRELGLEKNIRLPGALSHDVTVERIGRGSVFCLPARVCPDGDSDAMPVAIREAMARSRAVVSTNVAGIPEAVTNATGWIVDAGDVDALTQALAEALENGVERSERGLAGRRRCEREWTFAQQAVRLRRAFDGNRSQADRSEDSPKATPL